MEDGHVADGERKLKQNDSQEYDKSEVERNIDGAPSSAFLKISEQSATPQDLSQTVKTKAEVNMEANVTPNDVLRAGGFGATDGINSFLPVAMDCTDLECSLRDARDFEEPQGEISRPGLGYLDTNKC